jgi:hypothetical protein
VDKIYLFCGPAFINAVSNLRAVFPPAAEQILGVPALHRVRGNRPLKPEIFNQPI